MTRIFSACGSFSLASPGPQRNHRPNAFSANLRKISAVCGKNKTDNTDILMPTAAFHVLIMPKA
jgi:hypothetical protein